MFQDYLTAPLEKQLLEVNLTTFGNMYSGNLTLDKKATLIISKNFIFNVQGCFVIDGALVMTGKFNVSQSVHLFKYSCYSGTLPST